MSASLVGSEMCIRDRSSCTPMRPTKAQRAQLPCPRLGINDGQAQPGFRACLLYTSDAADDM
eukprot:12592153-Alexandrium_andersonii.AAC.1